MSDRCAPVFAWKKLLRDQAKQPLCYSMTVKGAL